MDRIGSWKLGEKIGSGGMGTVYRAVGDDGRVVAVKVLAPFQAVSRDITRRFLREIEVCRRLSHPHIVEVVDTGEHRGRPFLAMELLDGPSLKDRMSTGPLPVGFVCGIGAQIADALAYLHANRIIHRDLKPSNILLQEGRTVKLIDFGLVRVQDFTAITRTTEMVGTPWYLPPEVLNNQEYTEASDLYQLGLVLYEAFTGCYPWAVSTAVELFEKIQYEPVTDLADKVPDISVDVEDLILECLSIDPADRPESAAYVRDSLEAEQGGKGRRRPSLSLSRRLKRTLTAGVHVATGRRAPKRFLFRRLRSLLAAGLVLIVAAVAMRSVFRGPEAARIYDFSATPVRRGIFAAWSTSHAVEGRVEVRDDLGSKPMILGGKAARRRHEAAVTELAPDARYALRLHNGLDWSMPRTVRAGGDWSIQGPSAVREGARKVRLVYTSTFPVRGTVRWRVLGKARAVERPLASKHRFTVEADGPLEDLVFQARDAAGQSHVFGPVRVPGPIELLCDRSDDTPWLKLFRDLWACMATNEIEEAKHILHRTGWEVQRKAVTGHAAAVLLGERDVALRRRLLQALDYLAVVDGLFLDKALPSPFGAARIAEAASPQVVVRGEKEPPAAPGRLLGAFDLPRYRDALLPANLDSATRERLFEMAKVAIDRLEQPLPERSFPVSLGKVPAGAALWIGADLVNLDPSLVFEISLVGEAEALRLHSFLHKAEGAMPKPEMKSLPLLLAKVHIRRRLPVALLPRALHRLRFRVLALGNRPVMPTGLQRVWLRLVEP